MKYLKDPKTGEESVTLTVFVTGVLVSTLKLLTSGLSIGTVVLQPFTGVDYAAAIGALGAIYVMRRNSDHPPKP
jgi:hypothetical protein